MQDESTKLLSNPDFASCSFMLRAFRRFARWQVPDAFVVVNELPYTSTGKLLKSKLRKDFIDWEWDHA